MNKANQDYEELELYLQQAKEEIGLLPYEDQHYETWPTMAVSGNTNVWKDFSQTSGTWDLKVVKTEQTTTKCMESKKVVTEKLDHSATTLKVSYDVTLKHDVSMEHEVIIQDKTTLPLKLESVDKLEANLDQEDSQDFDKIIDLYDNVDFYVTEKVETGKHLEIRQEQVTHTLNNDLVGTEVSPCKVRRNVSDSYLEVKNTALNWREKNSSDSFEDVVLKLKDFLNERVKTDENRSDVDSSDEYLTAETDFDSITQYSGEKERHGLEKKHLRNEKIGYISSSENDSYFSDISNLENDFSDCRSLTSDDLKATQNGFFEQVGRENYLENQIMIYENENSLNDTVLKAKVDTIRSPSVEAHFDSLTKKTRAFDISGKNERGTCFDSVKCVGLPVTETLLEEYSNNCDNQADIDSSLQKEIDIFNLQINEIEKQARISGLHSIDGVVVQPDEKTPKIQQSLIMQNIDKDDSFTGLDDVENLLNRSLNELKRSLYEPNQHKTTLKESENLFHWDTKIKDISLVHQVGENGRKKARSISVPEIPAFNWKFSPGNEENIPTEMVVGPYASMSNSYNENWNSSVFAAQNVSLKQRLLMDHLKSPSRENFEKAEKSVSYKEACDTLGENEAEKNVGISEKKNCLGLEEHGQTDFASSKMLSPAMSNIQKMSNNHQPVYSQSLEDLEILSIPASSNRKEQIALDKKMKHPVTPPPPSANNTELLISDTLNLHRKYCYGKDNLHGLQQFHKDEKVWRKSADSLKVNENGLNDVIDSQFRRKSGSVINHLGKSDFVKITNVFQKDFNETCLDKNKENVDIVKGKALEDHDDERNSKILPTLGNKADECHDELCKSDNGLCNGVHVPKYSRVAANTSEPIKIIPKIQIKAPSFDSDSLKNETVSAKTKFSPFQNNDKTDKAGKENICDSGSKSVQTKDNMLAPKTVKNVPILNAQNKPVIKNMEYDISPEMQVMINSLSPVLLRRQPTKKYGRKTGTDSSESSPETEKKTHENQIYNELDPHLLVPDKYSNTSTEEKSSESLFMDPKMSQTWHGATSANWSQIYGPQMREMMRRLNEEKFDDTDAEQFTNQHFEEGCKTLPSSKSLLDTMHKKFCADQYNHNLNDIEMARHLVLLRLKSNKFVIPTSKRSASFHIKMGTGSSGSSESSPMLPRFSERRHIKTSPRMQYPNKAGRNSKNRTPEPLTLSKDGAKNEGPRKDEAEIEAVEACRWLKETGFPQYAQMYEDGQFPVDIDSVEKDHDFLDKEDIQSLFRRLNTLNKCAIMKIGTPTKKESEDSEDEDECALSDKWKYQRSSRRWSRKDLNSPIIETLSSKTPLKSSSSHDSLLADQNSGSETGDSPVLDSKMHHTTVDDMMLHRKHLAVDANGNATMKLSPKIRRAASERIKSAKSFLKRVESLKGRRRKPKNISDISGPVVANNADMQEKIKHLNCKEINSTNKMGSVPSSNTTVDTRLKPNLDSSTTLSSPEKSTQFSSLGNESMTVSSLDRTGDSSVFLSANSSFSDNDTINSVHTNPNGALGFSPLSSQNHSYDSLGKNTLSKGDYTPGKFPKVLDESIFSTNDSNVRTRSFSYIDESSELSSDRVRRRGSCDPRHQIHRVSIYDNVPVEEDLSVAQQELDIILSELFQNINGLNRAIHGDDAEVLHPPTYSAFDNSNISVEADGTESDHAFDTQSDTRDNEITSGTLSSPDISDHELHPEDLSHDDSTENIECRERRDSGVGSSLTRTNSDRRRYRIRWHSFQKSHRPNSDNRNLQLCNLSAGQILILRKLSLLKLTALLEKYSPNRSGWSLTVPRFMKRNKVPDYKDKNVFGVPFTVMIQRTGQALPQCLLHAMRYLRRTSRDALGIFRKSGVRSRIQKLRNEIEANPETIDFEELQAYDVADLVKQYFRELPECLLTNKLSDIFISIFIYVPAELRLEAMQAAIVLMVDEHRDVLQSLLLFLSDISQYASEHQMTASNLAVCFGPSLFNMGGFRHPNQTPSPRRNRKNPGIPDARELMEQKAAHECLTMMIQESKKLFTIPAGTISKCRCWHGDPVTLDELNYGTGEGDNQGYTSYIESCIQGLLKESRDKFRGWVSVPLNGDVDVSYKKVGDGHPLRLWKCTIDVEAPPNEVLNRVLNERHVWDEDLLQWNTIEKLDGQTEVFQFIRNSLAPHPTRDFCVLRSWRSELPKGACILISTSIDHPRAELQGGIRAVELASRYLIEPCGTGKSRLTHISRVDIRGHSPDWYKKVYGHICANFMVKIRSSFKQTTDGPETKV